MYFISDKISHFIKEKLGYPEALWQQMQEEYIQVFLIFLETEVNLYLEKKGLNEEVESLQKLSKSIKSEYRFEIVERFLLLYQKYPEIKKAVDKKFNQYFTGLMSALLDTLSDQSKDEFEILLESEAKKYTKKRKDLEETIPKGET